MNPENMKLNVDEIVRVTNGRILQTGKQDFSSFGIDSRKMTMGGLFFAMRGNETDGHLYVRDAVRNGASGAVVEKAVDPGGDSITMLQVVDSLQALQTLAASVRNQSLAKFIGITGSSGKTSTKEFTAAILSAKYDVSKSEGNLNSVTGLPLTLLAMNQPDVAVIEAGMSQPGEIASLSRIMKPQIAMVLNINPVHLEGLQSLDAIANEKLAITDGMSEDGLLIYNADDPLLSSKVKTVKQNTMSFGFSVGATIRVVDYFSEGVRGSRATFVWNDGTITFQTPLAGRGNILNLAGAVCAGIALQLTSDQIEEGIQKVQPYKQRGILLDLGGIHVYDDSYNSNPKAAELALQILEESTGFKRNIAVLGDMLELGPQEISFHEDAGKSAAQHSVDVLITAGPLSKNLARTAQESGVETVLAAENSEEAAAKTLQVIRTGDLILVKGSRGMKMEKVIEALRNR